MRSHACSTGIDAKLLNDVERQIIPIKTHSDDGLLNIWINKVLYICQIAAFCNLLNSNANMNCQCLD